MHKHRRRDRSGRTVTEWREKISEGPRGATRVRTVTAPTRAALREKLAGLERDGAERERRIAGAQLIREALPAWLESIRNSVTHGTWHAYELDTRRIVAHLGDLEVSKVLPSDVDRMLDQMLGTLKPRTVDHVRATLRRFLRTLTRDRILVDNAASLSRPVKVRRSEMRTWTAPQVARFLAHCQGRAEETQRGRARVNEMEALFTLALLRGMREGELLGLQRSRLNFDTRQIRIDCSLQEVDGKLVLMPTKSDEGTRTIAMPPQCEAALRRQCARVDAMRLRAGARWEDHDLVFPGRLGRPIRASDLRSRFRRAILAAKLPVITVHAMRHTCATLLLEQGVNPRVVQALLGHADVAITLRIYSHVRPHLEQEAGAQLEQRIFGQTGVIPGVISDNHTAKA